MDDARGSSHSFSKINMTKLVHGMPCVGLFCDQRPGMMRPRIACDGSVYATRRGIDLENAEWSCGSQSFIGPFRSLQDLGFDRPATGKAYGENPLSVSSCLLKR